MRERRPGFVLLGLAVVLALSGCASFERGTTGPALALADVAPVDSTTTTQVGHTEQQPTATPPSVDEPSVDRPTPEEPAVAESLLSEDAYPVEVRIREIDVKAEIIDLGLNEDGTLEVPKDFHQTGWYTGRSVPGNVGPSVVVGHVDSTTGPAVFYRLRDLEVGHLIEVERSDGVVALFRVSATEMVLKDEFPTEQVYGSTAKPALRLITCGGSYDRSVQSYKGNLIVYADHVVNLQPVQGPQTGRHWH